MLLMAILIRAVSGRRRAQRAEKLDPVHREPLRTHVQQEQVENEIKSG